MLRDRRRDKRQSTARTFYVLAFTIIPIGFFSLTGSVRAEEEPDAWLIEGLVNETLESERTGVEVPWSNDRTGNSGIIRVERTYYLADGTPCRDYVRTTEGREGGESTTTGSGCRVADGRWVLDEAPATEAKMPASTPAAAAKGGAKEAEAVAARPSSEAASAKSNEPEKPRSETWTPPPPAPKPPVPVFTLPTKSEL